MHRKPLSEGTALGLENWREIFSELIDLRGNPLLCITMKKYGIFIHICNYPLQYNLHIMNKCMDF
jgi:hypothetical protein